MVFDTSAPVPEITLINRRWYSQMTDSSTYYERFIGGWAGPKWWETACD